MGVILAVAVVAALLLALAIYAYGQRMSPDGKIYLAAARGERVPRPFHLRPLLPMILGTNLTAWRVASFVGLVVAAASIAGLAIACGLDAKRAVFAAVLFAALPIARTTAALPVLVDGPALALTAVSAMLAVSGYGIASALVALVGAAVKEHVPVFAALAAWSLWPLVGLIVPVALWMLVKRAQSSHPSVAEPLAYAREKHAGQWLDARAMLLPWGACLLAVFALSPAVALSLLVAYGMLFVAADSVRVYQWAAIPVCVAVAAVVPEAIAIPVALAHLWNPWQGSV
jgi:hypothetical protein